jgi:hypothetical protein
MKSKFFFHFFLFLFGFFIGNLFPTFFGQLLGTLTSVVLLFFFEFIHGWTGSRTRVSATKPIYPATQTSETVWLRQSVQATQFLNRLRRFFSFNNQSRTDIRKVSIASQTRTNLPNLPISAQSRRIEAQVTIGSANSSQSKNFRTLNSIKIGILFGLFVDAFKVGS